MTLKQVYELKRLIDSSTGALERILEAYERDVDGDMAHFIEDYMKSLRLDFELAMTRGESDRLQLIVEDASELLSSTELRIAQSRRRPPERLSGARDSEAAD